MSYRSIAKRKIPTLSENEIERTRVGGPKMPDTNDPEPNATETSSPDVMRTAIITADFSGLAFGDDRGGTFPGMLKLFYNTAHRPTVPVTVGRIVAKGKARHIS